jgi:hypothetical protein
MGRGLAQKSTDSLCFANPGGDQLAIDRVLRIAANRKGQVWMRIRFQYPRDSLRVHDVSVSGCARGQAVRGRERKRIAADLHTSRRDCLSAPCPVTVPTDYWQH